MNLETMQLIQQLEKAMIKIETVKCLDAKGHGTYGRKIVSITMLDKASLPAIYLKGFPCCFKVAGIHGSLIEINEDHPNSKCEDLSICVGSWQEEKSFSKALKLLHECGDRLKGINVGLKKKKDNWHGSETFVI